MDSHPHAQWMKVLRVNLTRQTPHYSWFVWEN